MHQRGNFSPHGQAAAGNSHSDFNDGGRVKAAGIAAQKNSNGHFRRIFSIAFPLASSSISLSR